VPQSIHAVLFDLDGTLLDTAPDLANALNHVLEQNGRAPLPYEIIRQVVSHGGRALIELGFGTKSEVAEFEQLRLQLLDYYKENICTQTQMFPGISEILETLENRGTAWGIVTNKPGWLTDPLLQKMQLLNKAGCVVSGDTLPECKPHPAPLLYASTQLSIDPQNCLYVGDAQRDIEAGRNAGMKTMVALFGYLLENDQPETWGADALIQTPAEILDWL
jgi:phosphoglycolate phosphatase